MEDYYTIQKCVCIAFTNFVLLLLLRYDSRRVSVGGGGELPLNNITITLEEETYCSKII